MIVGYYDKSFYSDLTIYQLYDNESFTASSENFSFLFGHDSYSVSYSGYTSLLISNININIPKNALDSSYIHTKIIRYDQSSQQISGIISALHSSRYRYNESSVRSVNEIFNRYAYSQTGLINLGSYNNIDITNILNPIINSNNWHPNDQISLKLDTIDKNSPLHTISAPVDSFIRVNYSASIPSQPKNLLVAPDYKQCLLSWSAPTDDGKSTIIEYQVEYQQADANINKEWIVAGKTNTLSFVVNNLFNGVEYIFRVAAINSIGIGEYSDISSVVSPSIALAPRALDTFNDNNYARIRLRRDTSTNWSGINPILGLGEAGYETDTKLLKIGDNANDWNSLEYVTVQSSSLSFPDPPEIHLVIGDSAINEDNPRIDCNLSNQEKFNIVGSNGINIDYQPNYNAIILSLDSLYSPFASGTLYSPTSIGRAGTVFTNDEYMYLCISPNKWKRIPLDTSFWFAPESIAISNNSGLYPSITNISFSGFNAIITTDGDPYPAKASSNLANDGITYRSDFFNNYQINDQNYNIKLRYRGGEFSHSPEISLSGLNGIFGNGVVFSSSSAGQEAVGIFSPPTGFHFDRRFFSSFYKVDDCGGYVNFNRQYIYISNTFLNRCWSDEKVYGSNDYYSMTNYNNDYYRHSDGHSKILGFCFDGYPIYGPFAYTDAASSSGGISLMTSSYVAKTSDDHRPSGWKFTDAISVNDINYNLTTGAFIEDYEYMEGSGLLDQYNGRYAITPEYPNGTYAYYLTYTDDSLMIAKYPYIIGNYSKYTKIYQNITSSINPMSVDGYFPVFTTTTAAIDYGLLHGGDGTYTEYTIYNEIYYMPNNIDGIMYPYAPTDIILSANQISEKATINSIIGTFSTIDDNLNDIHTYILISGEGDSDNSKFSIVNNELRVNSILSNGIQPIHSIRVRSSDQTNRFTEKNFEINVLAGTNFTSLAITSGISTLIAGQSHIFGSSFTGDATDITYQWYVDSNPYVSGLSANSYLEIDSTNIDERADEIINIQLTAKSISAFNTLTAITSFVLDHSETPVCIDGYYPLYSSQYDANRYPSGDGTSHIHTVQNNTYWMPNGLDPVYHGSFDCNSLT